VLPTVNTAMMSLHLSEIGKEVAPGAHAILVLDGAGYHGTARTRRPRGLLVPDNITLLHLPPSSPELNPMENVWQYLRQNKLANRVFRNYPHIVAACCEAWNFFANDRTTVASITKRAWITVDQ
jgi:transposase